MMEKNTLRILIYAGIFIVPFIPFLTFSSFFFPFITSKAFAFRIIVEIILAVWLMLAVADPAYRPRFSWITKAVLGFIIIIGLADIFGVAPLKSFWSNFERMEGFIALLHLGAYFLVLASVMKTEELWRRFWNTTLVASMIMTGFSVFQLVGVFPINQGGVRVDGTFGNATYLAVYILFHIFLAGFMLTRENKGRTWRIFYIISIILNLSILYFTATRGAILGLLVGVAVMGLTLLLGGKEYPRGRKASLATLVGLIALGGIFFLAKNSSFIQGSPVLSRFASISVEELRNQGRYFVWPMAVEGIKERPILGWGQDNFNYVFNEHYDPRMYAHEPWFDRAHNVILDWAIAGGILGLLSYFSILVALLYSIWKGSAFTFLEKVILTGLTSAYFFQNLFVFDNLISYILFFSLLSYVHVRSLGIEVQNETKKILPQHTQTAIALATAAIMFFILYQWNIKPIQANTSLIQALASIQVGSKESLSQTQDHFTRAVGRSRLGRPETREQIISNAERVLGSELTIEEKNEYFRFSRDQILEQVKENPNDARYHLIAGIFFSKTGFPDLALEHLRRAHELSPGKQPILYEIGAILINKGDPVGAMEQFKKAYELAPEYNESKIIYLLGAIYGGNDALARELLATIPPEVIMGDQRIASALLSKGRFGDAIAILAEKVRLNPNDPQSYAALADAYLKAGQPSKAIEVLKQMSASLPVYKEQVEEYINKIENGEINN